MHTGASKSNLIVSSYLMMSVMHTCMGTYIHTHTHMHTHANTHAHAHMHDEAWYWAKHILKIELLFRILKSTFFFWEMWFIDCSYTHTYTHAA